MTDDLDGFCGKHQEQWLGSRVCFESSIEVSTYRPGMGKEERELKVTGDSCLDNLQGRLSSKQIICPSVIFTDGSRQCIK